MSIIFKTEERRIIPRLRSFDLALSTGELSLNGNPKETSTFLDNKIFIDEQLGVWKNNKNLSYAGDILGSSFVLGVSDYFEDIAKYILDHSLSETDPLTKLANKVLTGRSEDLETDVYPLEDIESISKTTRHELRIVRHSLKLEPKNPIAWMELGRLYALEGQIEKAKKAIQNALSLDKDNRFIVRSASRFYHHYTGDSERALHVIKNAEFYKKDPWLLSADLAYSQVMNRFSRMIKVGESYVQNHSQEISSISELTSALGTLEFKNGNSKAAKKYFRQSLLMPTDNSLAQVNWIAENLSGFNVDTLNYQIPLAFEAKAIYYYENGNFNEAYEQAIKWHTDEPFSTRPIKAASYILGFYFKNFKASVELTRRGLDLDPNDVILANNLVYYLAQDGEMQEAATLFEKSLRKVLVNPDQYTINEQLYCNATAGLILFKQNQLDLGKLYYTKAIEISKKLKNSYSTALATVNYVRAALNSGIIDQEADSLIQQLTNTCRNSPQADIKYMFKEIVDEYNRRFEISN